MSSSSSWIGSSSSSSPSGSSSSSTGSSSSSGGGSSSSSGSPSTSSSSSSSWQGPGPEPKPTPPPNECEQPSDGGYDAFGLRASSGNGEEETCELPPEPPPGCSVDPNAASDFSEKPIRYFNGELQLAVTDMAAKGASGPWAQRRQYSNQLEGQTEVGLGYNWLVEAWPYLLKGPGGAISFVRSTRNALWFDAVESGGETSYDARYGGKATLTHDCDQRRYTLSMPTGEVWFFKDFGDEPCGSSSSSSGGAGVQPLPGQLRGMVDASGQQTDVVEYSTSGRIQIIERETVVDSETTTTQFEYAFDGSGLTTSVTYRRQVDSNGWVNIRRVTYEYYDGSTSH